MLTSESISIFKSATKYDLSIYFDRCELFFRTGYRDIADFFNGKISKVKTQSLDELTSLKKEALKINEQFKTNKSKFKTVDFWELIDFCETIKTKLDTCSNLDRFLRSSRTDFNFSQGFSHPYQLSNQQTLEDVSKDILKDNISENDWVDLALKNDLKEVDWSITGGKNITLYREKFVQNFVTSVVDNMVGEKIYGLDLNRKLEFFDDDLFVLDYKATVFQTVEIMSRIKRGDIPEFKYLGVPSNLYVGSNLSGLSYGGVIRDLKKIFSTDNLFINFKVKEIKQEQDAFFVDFSVETKYKLLIETTTLV